ncbi:MAG TPA: flagellin [Bryobacteraceae bacterium]|nr:flagellin [Bryobacteraceae bacterium]
MLSTLNPAAQQFLNGLNHIQQRAEKAQQELSTGLRIATVSDAPDQVSQLLQTQATLSRTQQIDQNLVNVKAQVDSSETALESAVSLVQQAQTLGAQGQSGFDSAATQQTVANQLGTVLQQLVTVANTQVDGRYVFAGDADQTQPYTIDLTQTTPVSAFAGSPSTRLVQSADGSLFAPAKTAQDIFDASDPTQSVFQSLTALRSAVLSGDSTAITAALGNVGTAGTFLNQQLAFYGNVQDQVTNATNFGANYETQLTTEIGGIQNADLTQVITEFTLDNTQEQAAIQAESLVPRQSLFSFLA